MWERIANERWTMVEARAGVVAVARDERAP
jgi:hypothetical protein